MKSDGVVISSVLVSILGGVIMPGYLMVSWSKKIELLQEELSQVKQYQNKLIGDITDLRKKLASVNAKDRTDFVSSTVYLFA